MPELAVRTVASIGSILPGRDVVDADVSLMRLGVVVLEPDHLYLGVFTSFSSELLVSVVSTHPFDLVQHLAPGRITPQDKLVPHHDTPHLGP